MLHHECPDLKALSCWDPQEDRHNKEPLYRSCFSDHVCWVSVCSFYQEDHERRGDWVVYLVPPGESGQGHVSNDYPDRPDLLAIIDRCFGEDPIPPGIFMDMFLEAL